MATPLPLSRFKVLDLTRVRSGPTAVRQFADWGADVLMIESPAGASEIAGARHSSDFQNLHRNKRSMTLDLKSAEGKAVLFKLAETADVLIENFRPDVKHRLGIGYETMQAVNPRLVYASISGFGEDGPYAERPGLDQIAQGLGGLMSVTGKPGEGPMRAGIAVADSAAGLYCALGVMTALLEREVTGQGRWVRTSLLQAQIAMLDFQAARWLVDGAVPPQEGNHHPTAVPMGLFETADGHVNLAASGRAMFGKFCALVGREEWLADPRFENDGARYRNREALRAEIADIMRTRPSAEWVELCNANGVPCGPVHQIDQMFADPQVQHLRMSRPVHSQARGDINLVSQAFTFADADFQIRAGPPALGEHTADVLEALGYDEAAIEDLRVRKIV
jgi:crotonobetainyl-CoA:carnitine CoA-transferase CaiB-like acyl-CoA transferase